jgi:hypothetical protein
MAAIGTIGERPDRKSLIGVLVIGISGILVTSGFGILESRNAKPRCVGARCQHLRKVEIFVQWEPAVSKLEKVESSVEWGPDVSQSRFKESGILPVYAFRNWKPRNPDEG